MRLRLLIAISSALSLLMVGCSADNGELTCADNEGVISFEVSDASSRSTDGDTATIYDLAMLKIYSTTQVDGDDEAEQTLIRRYAPMSECPDLLSLIEGDYRAEVTLDQGIYATFDIDYVVSHGVTDFEVVAKKSQQIEVECKMENSVVKVEFDGSIADNIKEGYQVVVMAADSYQDELIGVETTPQLIFTSSNTGYFALPDDVTNISWRFIGEKIYTSDGGDSSVTLDGVIANAQPREQTTLKFSYPKYLKVDESLSIYVDTSSEESDDKFSFEKQPQISGDDLLVTHEIDANVTSFEVSVNSFLNISRVALKVEDMEVVPFASGSAVDISDAKFVLNEGSTTAGVLTIYRSLFDNFVYGGDQSVEIVVTDSADIDGTAVLACKVSGISSISSYDFWNNTCDISALAVGSPQSVKVKFRESGASAWEEYDTTLVDGKCSVTIAPTWEDAGVNDTKNATIYKVQGGVRPSRSYECCIDVDGKESTIIPFTTEARGGQLENVDFSSDSMPCFTLSSANSSTWSSGNNSKADEYLCSSAEVNGDMCALLTTTKAGLSSIGVYKLAAGNINYGQFEMSSGLIPTGYMRFGQKFTWSARPYKLRLRYAATVGQSLTYTNSDCDYEGTVDRGRVYFAVVDWSDRHVVSASTDSQATDIWDPAQMSSTNEGKIIGYAATYIDQSTTTNELHDMELDIYYYQNTTAAPSGNITVVLSCTASAYGDYYVGSTDSRLWVDDFELVY